MQPSQTLSWTADIIVAKKEVNQKMSKQQKSFNSKEQWFKEFDEKWNSQPTRKQKQNKQKKGNLLFQWIRIKYMNAFPIKEDDSVIEKLTSNATQK